MNYLPSNLIDDAMGKVTKSMTDRLEKKTLPAARYSGVVGCMIVFHQGTVNHFTETEDDSPETDPLDETDRPAAIWNDLRSQALKASTAALRRKMIDYLTPDFHGKFILRMHISGGECKMGTCSYERTRKATS